MAAEKIHWKSKMHASETESETVTGPDGTMASDVSEDDKEDSVDFISGFHPRVVLFGDIPHLKELRRMSISSADHPIPSSPRTKELVELKWLGMDSSDDPTKEKEKSKNDAKGIELQNISQKKGDNDGSAQESSIDVNTNDHIKTGTTRGEQRSLPQNGLTSRKTRETQNGTACAHKGDSEDTTEAATPEKREDAGTENGDEETNSIGESTALLNNGEGDTQSNDAPFPDLDEVDCTLPKKISSVVHVGKEPRNSWRSDLHGLSQATDSTGELNRLLTLIKEQGMNLCEDKLLGKKFKETALAAAVVQNNTASAKILIDFGGQDIICKAYVDEKYEGTTALHLAILKENIDIIRHMLDRLDDDAKKTLVNSVARGKYLKYTYNCGWSPLALAAATGNLDIFDVLVRNGADILAADADTGNTIFHNLAKIATKAPARAIEMLHGILNSKDVENSIFRNIDHQTVQKNSDARKIILMESLLKMKNVDNCTPMVYAVCLGATQFACELLNMEKLYTFTSWQIGPDKFSRYEVSEVDTSVERSSSGPSVLEVYTFVHGDNSLNLGKSALIREVTDHKWKVYRHWFILWCIYHLLMMILFTICMLNRKHHSMLTENFTRTENETSATNTSENLQILSHGIKDEIILAFECLVVMSAMVYGILEITDVICLLSRNHQLLNALPRRKRWFHFWFIVQVDTFRFLLFLFWMSTLVLLCVRFSANRKHEDIFFALGSVSGWSFLLFFTRPLKKIGLFTGMFQRTVTKELTYFVVVLIIILVAFGSGMYGIYQQSEHYFSQVSSIWNAYFSMFRIAIGMDDFDILENSNHIWVAKMMFIVFSLFAHVLLLNMLIAAVNCTYLEMSEKQDLMWIKRRTKAVLLLERRLKYCRKTVDNLQKVKIRGSTLWFLNSEKTDVNHPMSAWENWYIFNSRTSTNGVV